MDPLDPDTDPWTDFPADLGLSLEVPDVLGQGLPPWSALLPRWGQWDRPWLAWNAQESPAAPGSPASYQPTLHPDI